MMLPPPASPQTFPVWLYRLMERADARLSQMSWDEADEHVLAAMRIASVRTWWQGRTLWSVDKSPREKRGDGSLLTTMAETRRCLRWGVPTKRKDQIFEICWYRLFLQGRTFWNHPVSMSDRQQANALAHQRAMPAAPYQLPPRIIQFAGGIEARNLMMDPIPQGSLDELADAIAEAIDISATLRTLAGQEAFTRRCFDKHKLIVVIGNEHFSLQTLETYFEAGLGILRFRHNWIEIDNCSVFHPALVRREHAVFEA